MVEVWWCHKSYPKNDKGRRTPEEACYTCLPHSIKDLPLFLEIEDVDFVKNIYFCCYKESWGILVVLYLFLNMNLLMDDEISRLNSTLTFPNQIHLHCSYMWSMIFHQIQSTSTPAAKMPHRFSSQKCRLTFLYISVNSVSFIYPLNGAIRHIFVHFFKWFNN